MSERAGVQLARERESTLQARLAPVARRHSCESLRELVMLLQSNPKGDVAVEVLDALTVHETSWFRDREFFQFLRHKLLPALIADRTGSRKLRIWSAGCSTGQEPFSLSMILHEEFERLLSWDLLVFASDVSPLSVQKAETGVYSQIEMNRGLSARELIRHFDRDQGHWRAKQKLRSTVNFQVFSLTEPWTLMEHFDLILLRNVLIYFDDATRAEVIRRIRRHMAPGGFLCLGAAEMCRELGRRDFELVELHGQVLLRKPA